jgi:hypothetical protein
MKKKLESLLKKAGYKTYKDKHGITRWQKAGRYTLAHGEYERPDYRIIKRRGMDHYYIYGRYYFYAGTYDAGQDGELSDSAMDALHDEAFYNEQ